MKHFFQSIQKPLGYFSIIAFFFIGIVPVSAQVYVNQAATGKNDGSSWLDAYTELADALTDYKAGDEIWVARGTYLPKEQSTLQGGKRQTFYINRDVKLYGGFNGSETKRSQRDPGMNVTILSGDISGDDILDDFESKRADNVINVIYIENNITTATLLDGFTVMGGHADVDDDFYPNKRGGALFSWGAAQINNCTFQQNYTIWHGGAVYYYNKAASGGRIENCLFQKNKCLNSGAGISIASVYGKGVHVENCRFLNNEANRGGGLYLVQSNGAVNNCQFLSNTADIVGGAMYIIFNDELGESGLNTKIRNCEFKENHAESAGGAVYYYNYKSTDHQVAFNDCQFLENTSANGGGFFYQSAGTEDGNLSFMTCTFRSNKAIRTAKDSLPDAGGLGIIYDASLTSQKDTIRMVNCKINDNSAESIVGGVLYLQPTGKNNHFQMDNCEVIGNSEGSGFAVGGVGIGEGGENTSALIRNTHFEGNMGPRLSGFFLSQVEGVPLPKKRHIELINCLFTKHHSSGPIKAVVGTDKEREFILTNCTFTNNQSPLLSTDDNGKIVLKNTILHSNEYPTFTSLGTSKGKYIKSLGGNLVSDDAISQFLVNTDQSNTDPIFKKGSYKLSKKSPGANAGIQAKSIKMD